MDIQPINSITISSDENIQQACWYYAGTNYNACLMQPGREDYHKITKFEDEQNFFLNNLSRIVCGPKHCIGIGAESNEVYIWGETYISKNHEDDNNCISQFQQTKSEAQEVGFHKEMLISDPYRCILEVPISQVSIGFDHTLFLSEEINKLFVQGMGKQGELGLGTITKVSKITPIHFEFENQVMLIKAGVKRSFVVTVDSILYAWGKTDFGKQKCIPTKIEESPLTNISKIE